MMVAEVMMMISAMRVTVENVPALMVSMPRVSRARCDSGTMRRYHTSRKGVATKDGTSHLTLHWTRLVLRAGSLSPSMRLEVMRAQTPASEVQTPAAQQQARPVGGIEERVPELAGLVPCAGDREPGVARREHEGENAVDDDERGCRGAGVDPAHSEVQLGIDAIPGVVVDGDGGEFDQEEDPLHGPAEDEVVNQRAGGLGMREADGEPDAHAGDGAEDSREDEEEFGVAGKLFEPGIGGLFVRHAHRFAFGHREIEAAAHGELRDHDVKDGDDADDPA